MIALALALTISSASAVATASIPTNPAGLSEGPAGSPTGIATAYPLVVAVPVDTDCGAAELRITAPVGTELEFGGDIGDQPPLRVAGVVTLPLHALPGTYVVWRVEDYRTDRVFAEGAHYLPPCISAPLRPDVVVDDEVVLGPAVRLERRRAAVWEHVLQMVRGMW